MILISHPTGNANVVQAALSFLEAGVLEEFFISVVWDDTWRINKILSERLRTQLGRRTLPSSLLKKTKTYPLLEACRHICSACGLEFLTRHERGMFSIDAVYRDLDRRVAARLERKTEINSVYCYEDAAESTFFTAKQRGIRCCYDLPIGYWRVAQAIYAEESIREPEWAPTLSGCNDSNEKLERKEREMHSADIVVVASTFTKRTLETSGVIKNNIFVVPYGAPSFEQRGYSQKSHQKLRVLFVGGLTQRKGLSYFFAAVRRLRGLIDVTVIGKKTTEICGILNNSLKEHSWIATLPHSQILAEMVKSDVLVFPSLFEGFGLVILEAMACGIPVITTPHTAGPDIITDGIDGFIVPIRSADAIAARLIQLAENASLLTNMKRAALATAKAFTWESYRKQLQETVIYTHGNRAS